MLSIALESQGFGLILASADGAPQKALDALRFSRESRPEIAVALLAREALADDFLAALLESGAADVVSDSHSVKLTFVIRRAPGAKVASEALETSERQVRESRSFAARLLESLTSHAAIVIGLDGRIEEWNHAASLMFGYVRDEAVGLGADVLRADADRSGSAFKDEAHKVDRFEASRWPTGCAGPTGPGCAATA